MSTCENLKISALVVSLWPSILPSLALDCVLQDEPIFCKIQYVFCTKNQVVYLAVNDFLSLEYYPHFHSYVMASTNSHLGPIRLLKVDDLYDFHTYKLFQSFDCNLRHILFVQSTTCFIKFVWLLTLTHATQKNLKNKLIITFIRICWSTETESHWMQYDHELAMHLNFCVAHAVWHPLIKVGNTHQN